MRKKLIYKIQVFYLLFLLANGPLYAQQRFGLPGVYNYTHSEYRGGTQNWSLGQADNGKMYFANNSGLVEFDGAQWKIYQSVQPLNRALYIDGNRVYVGAFNEFGYYEANPKGNLIYHSLRHLINNRLAEIDDIWRIHKTSFGIVFQAFNAMLIYDKNKIDIVYPRSLFHMSYYVNGILWVFDEKNGLMQYREGKVRQIPAGDFFIGKQIWTIMPLDDDRVIIGTAKLGLFLYDGNKVTPWNTPVNNLLKTSQIYSAVKTKNYFAFGTIQNGLIVADTAGSPVFVINKERGLQNNTILSIGADTQGNLWLGLDNGISVVDFNTPLTFIQNYYDIGSGYTSARVGDMLYLGTNQGLFYIRWNDFVNPLKTKNDFHLIEGTEGQVWSLEVIDNTLFCGHNYGVFTVQGTTAHKISNVAGGWCFYKTASKPSLILVGNYLGISVFENRGGQWQYRNELNDYNYSSRFMQMDAQGNIWVSHGYKGIIKVVPDAGFRRAESFKIYNSGSGLPSDFDNNLFPIHNDLLIATRQGLYKYNIKTDKFEPYQNLKQFFNAGSHIFYLLEDRQNNIWFNCNQQWGVLRFQEDGSYKRIDAPFSKLEGKLIASYGHVNVIDINSALIGIESGFAHYTGNYHKNYDITPYLQISYLHSKDTAEGIYNYSSVQKNQQVLPRFRYRNNNITIAYAASGYAENSIQFQYKLEGFDKEWSAWTTQTAKEYTNLHHGVYTFLLRAKTASGAITPELSYKFEITPPWYLATYAWIVYALLFVGAVYLSYRFFERSMERSRQKENERQKMDFFRREQKLKEEALINEKEMIRLRNEHLNLEMVHKEKELANSTMLIIQKNEILTKIKTDLSKARNKITDEQVKNELSSTIKRIGKEIDNERQWQVFDMHVEQVHEELFKKLKERFPQLGPRELKLCAYLRMNISSKEIATLMNISTRGVEISRYRLRKKMGLSRSINLTDYIMGL